MSRNGPRLPHRVHHRRHCRARCCSVRIGERPGVRLRQSGWPVGRNVEGIKGLNRSRLPPTIDTYSCDPKSPGQRESAKTPTVSSAVLPEGHRPCRPRQATRYALAAELQRFGHANGHSSKPERSHRTVLLRYRENPPIPRRGIAILIIAVRLEDGRDASLSDQLVA